jgi:hypothetical protein
MLDYPKEIIINMNNFEKLDYIGKADGYLALFISFVIDFNQKA